MNINLILLVISGLFSGMAQVVNKRLTLSGHLSTTYTAVIMLVNAVISIPLLFYQRQVSHSFYYWILIVASTAIYAFSTYFGFKAYKKTDVSTVTILQRLNVVFVALIGVTLLKEEYSIKAAIGLFLIFSGGVLIVMKGRKFKISSGIFFAVMMALTGAIATVLDKVILEDFSPFTYVFVNNLLVGSVFLPKGGLIRDAKDLIKKRFLLIVITSVLTTLSFISVLIVLQRTNVSQTMPVQKGLSLVTPVVIGILILRERKDVSKKIIGTILGLIGIIMQY